MTKTLRCLSYSLLLTLGLANAQNNTPVDPSKFEVTVKVGLRWRQHHAGRRCQAGAVVAPTSPEVSR